MSLWRAIIKTAINIIKNKEPSLFGLESDHVGSYLKILLSMRFADTDAINSTSILYVCLCSCRYALARLRISKKQNECKYSRSGVSSRSRHEAADAVL